MSEEYSVGYSEGYQAGWNAAMDATPPKQPAPVQEPVGYWLIGTDHVEFDKHEYHDGPEWEAIYTTPPAAQPAPVQPVGTYGEIFESMLSLLRTGLQRDQQIYMEMKDKHLYTTPPAAQRQWVGLTEQEAAECWSTSTVRTWQAIEAKLKEKNNG
jgi:hypothetical protein